MPNGRTIVLAATLLTAGLAWGQSQEPAKSSPKQQGKAEQINSGQVDSGTASGPRMAPENERPIRREDTRWRTPPPELPDCRFTWNRECRWEESDPQQSGDASGDALEDAPQGGDQPQGESSSQPLQEGSGDLLQDVPRNPEETSSSRQTKIELGGPAGASSANELRPYDPHKAAKDIEVGEYYFKRGNYQAAISRFRGALEFKPGDALATFRLAEALEQNGDTREAMRYYSVYLDILPGGDFALQSREALDRLDASHQAAAPAR